VIQKQVFVKQQQRPKVIAKANVVVAGHVVGIRWFVK
jgi:hypothetical protein